MVFKLSWSKSPERLFLRYLRILEIINDYFSANVIVRFRIMSFLSCDGLTGSWCSQLGICTKLGPSSYGLRSFILNIESYYIIAAREWSTLIKWYKPKSAKLIARRFQSNVRPMKQGRIEMFNILTRETVFYVWKEIPSFERKQKNGFPA